MTRAISPRTRIGVCPETETTINIYFIPERSTIGGVRTNYDGWNWLLATSVSSYWRVPVQEWTKPPNIWNDKDNEDEEDKD